MQNYHKIGDRFPYEGVVLEVVEEHLLSCLGCFFYSPLCSGDGMFCNEDDRPDGKNVIFKHIKI